MPSIDKIEKDVADIKEFLFNLFRPEMFRRDAFKASIKNHIIQKALRNQVKRNAHTLCRKEN